MSAYELIIPATDGFELGGIHHTPPKDLANGKVLLMTGAIGVKQSLYQEYASFFAEEGYTVYTFDYRGIGASRPARLRGFEASLREWGEKDIAGVLGWVSEQHPGAELLYVGHSAGGQLLGLAANNDRVARVLMLAAPSGYWRLWRGREKLFIASTWFVLIPVACALLGYFPGRRLGLGADLPAGVARNWARWGKSPHYISDEAGRPIREHYETFRAPIRSYSFDDDSFAPEAAVAHLLSFYSAAPREHKHLEPADAGVRSIGHLSFFRARKFRDTLWRETADWLAER